MMKGFRGAALQHQKMAFAWIDADAQAVTLELAPEKSPASDPVSKVLGSRASVQGTGVEEEVSALVLTPSQRVREQVLQKEAALVGLYAISDLVLLVKLKDVLVTADKVFGRTKFDLARKVIVQGSEFKVVGTDRTGLPPVGPYLFWAGLKGMGSER